MRHLFYIACAPGSAPNLCTPASCLAPTCLPASDWGRARQATAMPPCCSCREVPAPIYTPTTACLPACHLYACHLPVLVPLLCPVYTCCLQGKEETGYPCRKKSSSTATYPSDVDQFSVKACRQEAEEKRLPVPSDCTVPIPANAHAPLLPHYHPHLCTDLAIYGRVCPSHHRDIQCS